MSEIEIAMWEMLKPVVLTKEQTERYYLKLKEHEKQVEKVVNKILLNASIKDIIEETADFL